MTQVQPLSQVAPVAATLADHAPCPFCASKISGVVTNGDDNFYLSCENCGAEGPTAPTEAEAIAAWNRRSAVEQAKPVAKADPMPGTSGFTMAVFKASDVPAGTPVYSFAASSMHNVLRAQRDELVVALEVAADRLSALQAFQASTAARAAVKKVSA